MIECLALWLAAAFLRVGFYASCTGELGSAKWRWQSSKCRNRRLPPTDGIFISGFADDGIRLIAGASIQALALDGTRLHARQWASAYLYRHWRRRSVRQARAYLPPFQHNQSTDACSGRIVADTWYGQAGVAP